MLDIKKINDLKSKTLGNNIKSIRKKSNYTQEEFAEKLDITPQFLSSVERGINNISLTTAINICKITNCSPSLLFKDIINAASITDKYELLNSEYKDVVAKMIEYLLEIQ